MCPPDLSSGNIGPEAKYDIAFDAGKFNLTLAYQGKQAGLSTSGYIDAAALITALESAIKANALEDEILEMLKGVLTAIP